MRCADARDLGLDRLSPMRIANAQLKRE